MYIMKQLHKFYLIIIKNSIFYLKLGVKLPKTGGSGGQRGGPAVQILLGAFLHLHSKLYTACLGVAQPQRQKKVSFGVLRPKPAQHLTMRRYPACFMTLLKRKSTVVKVLCQQTITFGEKCFGYEDFISLW